MFFLFYKFYNQNNYLYIKFILLIFYSFDDHKIFLKNPLILSKSSRSLQTNDGESFLKMRFNHKSYSISELNNQAIYCLNNETKSNVYIYTNQCLSSICANQTTKSNRLSRL